MTRLRAIVLLFALGALALGSSTWPVPAQADGPAPPLTGASCCASASPTPSGSSAAGCPCCERNCGGDDLGCSTLPGTATCPCAGHGAPVYVGSLRPVMDPARSPAGILEVPNEVGSSLSLSPPVPPPLGDLLPHC